MARRKRIALPARWAYSAVPRRRHGLDSIEVNSARAATSKLGSTRRCRLTRKVVRFYELLHVQSTTLDDEPKQLESGFWEKFHRDMMETPVQSRQINIRMRKVHGEARIGVSPARRYFYIGGLRNRSEWPDSLSDETGVVSELAIGDEKVSLIEPAYVVPFGHRNQVAVLNMSQSSPRVSTIESWVTAALSKKYGYGGMLMLTPIINSKVQQRLEEAVGATKFRVKIEPGATIPEVGGGAIGHAARTAKQVSGETDLEIIWSLANRSGSTDTTSKLLGAARWVRDDWAKRASVGLLLEEEGRLRRHTYNLLKEYFTSAQEFTIKPNEPPSELSVLTGIDRAIEQFRAEFS